MSLWTAAKAFATELRRPPDADMERQRAVLTALARPRSFTTNSTRAFSNTKAYRDQSLSWVVATRGWYPCEVVDSWEMIQWPMNQFRSVRFTAKGMEVAAAYNALIDLVTDKELVREALGDGAESYADSVAKSRFVLVTEEDNIIPPDAVVKLLAAMFRCPDCGGEVAEHCAGQRMQCDACTAWRCSKGHKGYDAIGGLYSVKAEPPIPMAYGDISEPGDFRPRFVEASLGSDEVLEVNGVAMGCTIFHKDIFRRLSKPWFDTGVGHTQDLFFCKKAKEELGEGGARFGVHCGVEVGHLNVTTGEII